MLWFISQRVKQQQQHMRQLYMRSHVKQQQNVHGQGQGFINKQEQDVSQGQRQRQRKFDRGIASILEEEAAYHAVASEENRKFLEYERLAVRAGNVTVRAVSVAAGSVCCIK